MEKDTPTPHNAAKYGDIAKTVLMAGDPLRAKFLADTFLEDSFLYNQVRGMLGFTGKYKGKTVSVQGHGMGIPSICIYSHELYAFYDVDTIIRIGTAGTADPNVELGTVIICEDAESDSNFGYQYGLPAGRRPKADPELVAMAREEAEKMGIPHKVGTIFSSDVFYESATDISKYAGVEMEAYGLYTNADHFGKKAITIVTITDSVTDPRGLSPEERQTGLRHMMELALNVASRL